MTCAVVIAEESQSLYQDICNQYVNGVSKKTNAQETREDKKECKHTDAKHDFGNIGQMHRIESASLIMQILKTSARFRSAQSDVSIGIVVGLERGIFNRAIDLLTKKNVVASWIIPSFVSTYKMVRQLLCEKIAKIGENPALESIIMDRKREWASIAAASIYDLFPDQFAQNRVRVAARSAAFVKVTYTDKTCPECGMKKVKESSIQCRSADESSTSFLFCYGCNKQIGKQ